MPGFPVLPHLLELAQTNVYQARDAIQPSHFLSSPSSPALSLSHIRVFSNESVLHIKQPKYSFSISPSNEYSGLISFNIDWLDLLAVQLWTTKALIFMSQFKSINPWVFSLLYGPTLTSIHVYWKNHSFEYTGLCW